MHRWRRAFGRDSDGLRREIQELREAVRGLKAEKGN
jgi:hypothetical protein